jgi:SPP1 gp7 family putative phage head morphogenesis protein
MIERIKKWFGKSAGEEPEVALAPAPRLPAGMKGELGWAADSVIYSGRDFPKWNPDRLLSLKGREVYRRMMHDDQVKAVVRFKQFAVISRGWSFEIGTDEDGNERADHLAMAEFFGYCLTRIRGHFSNHLVGMLSALENGFSITEMIFAPVLWRGVSMWGLDTLKLRPFHTFLDGFEVDGHGNVGRLIQNQGSGRVEIPYGKVIHFVYQPDVDAHYGESDLRACYRAWWSKDVAIKFQNIHLERHAGGFLWAQVDRELTNTESTRLKNLISNISARMGAVLPGGVTLNAIQPLSTSAFDNAIEQHDKSIAKAVLVPNLLGMSEQGDTGSYSQSQTQIDAFCWILDQLSGALAEALNEQMFGLLAQWNFGTEDFPRFRFEPVSAEVKRSIAQTWANLVAGGAVERTDTDEAYVRRMMGFPEKGETEGGNRETETGKRKPENGGADEPAGGMPDNEEWVEELPEEQKEAVRREFAEKPWLRRIDFSALERRMNESEQAFLDELQANLAEMRLDLERQIRELGGERSWGNVEPKEIERVKNAPAIVSRMRKILHQHLKAGLEDGYSGARSELPKRFAEEGRIAPGMDKTQAWKFLSRKAMKIAGITEADVIAAVWRVLENAIKYDKSLKDVIAALEEDTDLIKLLPRVDHLGRAVNVAARVENIVRTNLADALNQGRQALFGSPELRGFVLAYEYSAILDARTSEICEALHGQIRKDWGSLTPPNHYMCRSILVPVTAVDDWDGKESPAPRVTPQKGFY